MTFGDLVRVAIGPVGSGLLLALVIGALLVELQTLAGIGAAVATLALFGFFAAQVLGGNSDLLVVGVGLVGLLLLLGEVHFSLSGGVLGLFGGIAVLLAIFAAFGIDNAALTVTALAIAIVLGVVLFVVARRVMPQRVFARRSIALESVQGPDYVAAPDLRAFLGRSGMTLSYLRPAGVAMIDGRRVDVLTDGEFVAAGAPIVVTRVEGARVFVRPEA